MCFQDLREVYNLENEDFFRYLQLRDYFTREIQNPDNPNGVIGVMEQACNGTRFKTISALYQNLRNCKPSSTLYIKAKWEKELN